jgi:hypothetical protein
LARRDGEPPQALCHCGLPLHYRDPEHRRAIEEMIALAGGDPYIDVVVHTASGRRTWRVQRHYIALHGITAAELPTLGFEEIQ